MNINPKNIFTTNNSKAISKLYYLHRDSFIGFGKKYGLDYEDLTDIYQEAFIALRNHAINGKLDHIKCTIKTYLFGIGKFMIYDLLKEKKKTTNYQPNIHVVDDEIESIPFSNAEELTIEQHLLKKFFIKLGKKCQALLTLFYSRGLSIEDIIHLTNYTSSSVVRSQKSRCLKNLKEMINS